MIEVFLERILGGDDRAKLGLQLKEKDGSRILRLAVGQAEVNEADRILTSQPTRRLQPHDFLLVQLG